MRKETKSRILDVVKTIFSAHDDIEKLLKKGITANVAVLLGDCQDAVISVGEIIQNSEGEEHKAIILIENYCRELFDFYNALNEGKEYDSSCKALNSLLTDIKKCIEKEIRGKIEVVFMPYKASMWDSLESVWKAADEDPDCDAYVVPIPYYDRNPDHSFGEFHYEGNQFPDYVPVTHYMRYDERIRKPDVIYIHNPYDDCNYVTSVDPRFYSFVLKKSTNNLIYIPYFSSAGEMSEGQKYCSVYYHADHIVIQSERFKEFYDPSIPNGKFLPFGSPKFDRVINMCKNPPQMPDEWRKKTSGKKVYFYNTSLSGMLNNTEAFLKKMKYVFDVFEKNKEACILWRPHPLLESTFESMRPLYLEMYRNLREHFITNDIGIYDDTSDISASIAFCNAYIGDNGTSVTSLFGVCGKPMFLLNNNINSIPQDDDWKGEYIRGINDQWIVTWNNYLYYSADSDYKYKYLCELAPYNSEWYYSLCVNVGKVAYAVPANARDIVKVDSHGIIKRISLRKGNDKYGVFAASVLCDRYIYLLPYNYPWIVRLDTIDDSVEYIKDNHEFIMQDCNGVKLCGGFAYHNGKLYVASSNDDRILIIDPETGKSEVFRLGIDGYNGCIYLYPDNNILWFLPANGTEIITWDTVENKIDVYGNMPNDFVCVNYNYNYECLERPFTNATRSGKYIYFAPYWANMFIKINTDTGEIEKWEPSEAVRNVIKNGYYFNIAHNEFLYQNHIPQATKTLVSYYDNKLYKVDFDNNKLNEINVEFDKSELISHERGFDVEYEGSQYYCKETVFNSLEKFIKNDIIGNQFDTNKQFESFRMISADHEGSCGRKIYEFIKNKTDV